MVDSAIGPDDVAAAADAAVVALQAVVSPSAVTGSRAQWAAAAGAAQRAMDVAAAVQDAAIVRLAAIEPEWCEDGTEVETHHSLGHVALDAPAIVSGVLSVSVRHAEQRVEAAVLLAADGPEGSGTDSGLGGLHAAMGEGRLDSYRAGVVAEELAAAPPQVRETVVTMLEGHFEVEDGAHLRRRCRRALARISPELLLERAKRARAECGLRRWVAEPGVDRWEGTFPSEDAARAWAAIDVLAHRYVKDGVCTHIEAARGKALTDLVAGQATIEAVLTLTVPAAAVPAGAVGRPAAADACAALDESGEDDLVEVIGPAGNQAVFVSRNWVRALAGARAGNGGRPSRAATVEVAPCHPDTGALVDPASLAPRDPRLEQEASLPQDQAIGQDATHGDAPEPDAEARNDAAEPNRTDPSADTPNRAVQPTRTDPGADAPNRAGSRPHRHGSHRRGVDPAADRRGVRGGGVPALGPDGETGQGPRPQVPLPRLHRRGGVLRPRPRPALASRPDRRHQPDLPVPTPPPRQTTTRLVCRPGRRRHRHLDRPHRTGPHHRTRRRPDLHHPRRRRDTRTGPASTSVTLTALPDGPHSDLEFLLEHHAATVPTRCRASTTWRDDHGRRHRIELQPAVGRVLADDGWPHHPNRGHRQLGRHIRRRNDDPPPF